jgi:hypothetical protein
MTEETNRCPKCNGEGVPRRGIYEVSRYERTISRTGVMDLRVTRIRDGKIVRGVTGSLLPVAD